MGPENLGNGAAATQDRFSGPLAGYRTGGRRDGDSPDSELQTRPTLAPRLAGESELDRPAGPPAQLRSLGSAAASAGLDGLTEPVFSPAGWLDGTAASLADHPLLRGLLLELPPKGTVPAADWLDRWFEAARSILELLYLHDAPRSR